MVVRSLYVVNLAELVREVNASVIHFMNEYGITSTNDLTNLFISRMLERMTVVYKEVRGRFIVFFLNVVDREKMLAVKDVVNYKRFLNIVEKRVKFPLCKSTLSYNAFVKMLFTNCPEYDEIMTKHKSFAECFPAFAEIVRKFKYRKINEEIVKDLREVSLLVSSM